ncbi:MAG TPA: VanZ family protein, partial [Firmicutes bacterium]|nr:VanZ family protein [Bacillota bacterium]
MQYVKAIKSSFLFFPLVALLITVPFIISNYHKYGSIHKLRTFIIYSFVLYLLTIYFLVILPLPNIDEVSKLTTPTMNLIPFSFVGDFIKDSPLVLNDPSTYIKAILDSSFYVVIFNIFMTIPLGMYLKYYYKCSFLKTSLICFLVSLFFEITQLTGLYFIYPRPYRLFDVDDLILNTSGGMIGYGIMCLIDKYLPSRDKIDMESKTLANVVSPLRRLTIAFLDLFLYFILVIIMSIFIGNHHVLIVSFIIYYLIIPVILKERTIASKF